MIEVAGPDGGPVVLPAEEQKRLTGRFKAIGSRKKAS